MILFSICAAALSVAIGDAATSVAVIELGKSGTVRPTAGLEETSVDGVASFWSALHGYGRKLQHAGMTVVPDLFSRPESGVVIGLSGSGVDLNQMPTLNDLFSSEDKRVVGKMKVLGNQCKKMLNIVKLQPDHKPLNSLKDAVVSQAVKPGISGMHVDITTANAASIDNQISSLVKDYASSLNEGKTVVIHLVIEEEEDAARRRSLSRRLDGMDLNRYKVVTQRRLEEADADADAQANNNGYYGYGYYNAYGEWVTPYKTMFQIQYFNVVLWTSLGLLAILFFSIYMMIYMPLMADTLLFGESARVAD